MLNFPPTANRCHDRIPLTLCPRTLALNPGKHESPVAVKMGDFQGQNRKQRGLRCSWKHSDRCKYFLQLTYF